MNTRLITSDNMSAVLKEIISQARDAARGNIDPIFIIVPDRFTLQTERLLLSGGGCLLNTEVVTFSKLFHLLFEELGNESKPVLDKTSAVLFMWRAVQSVKDKLVWFGRSVSHYAFAEKMFNTINQLTSSMVDFNNLVKNARNGTVTAKKMHDIAVIREAYKQLIAEYTDSSGQLGFLIENIKRSKIIREAKIFIAGFEHLSVQRCAVIAEIIKKAKAFTAGVHKGSELEQFIQNVCFDSGIVPEIMRIDYKSTGKIQSLGFSTVQNEAEWITNQICGLVKNRGARFRDITVCLCDFQKSAKVYAQIFAENGIAVNVDVGMDLLLSPIAQYIKEYLALVSSGRSEHFINIIKSKYSGLNADAEFTLENEALKTNMRSNEITAPHVKALQKCKTAADFCVVLKKLVPSENEELLELLETVGKVSGDMKINAQQFLNLFCTLTAATKISDIPSFSDAVTLIDTAEHQPSFTAYLFVASASEELFPPHQDDTDIITGQDIGNMSVHIEPSPELQNRRNRIHANNVLSSFINEAFITFSGENPSAMIASIPQTKTPSHNAIASKTYAETLVLRAIGDGTAFENPVYYNSVLKSLEIGDMPVHNLYPSMPDLKNGAELFFRGSTGRVTQIENFYKCPYYHFLQNGLSIKPREKYRIAANITGILIHKIAEDFTNRIIKHGSLTGFDETYEIQDVVKNVLEKPEFAFLAEPVHKPVVSSLKRETKKIADTIATGIKESDYFPRFTEMPLEKQFGDIRLKGKADRVDTTVKDGREHAIIIDYKTGSDVSFSMGKLESGLKLQLPLYMGFLPDKYIADGAYYLSLSGGYTNADGGVRTKGITKNVAEAITKSSELAHEAVRQISSGCIRPVPNDKKTCEYCIAKAMCGVKT